MNSYFVYILTCNNNSTLYIGVTNDLKRRIYEHKNHFVDSFSSKYHTQKLIYFEETSDIYSAIQREKQLKKWKRENKIKLINSFNPEWKDLSLEEFD